MLLILEAAQVSACPAVDDLGKWPFFQNVRYSGNHEC